MKKIFSLAIALIAFVGVANAQGKVMQVNLNTGEHEDYYTSQVESVTFKDDSWEYLGTGTYYLTIAWNTAVTDCSLYRNSESPTNYRIDGWRASGYPFYFTYDESTDKMEVVTDTDTGYKSTSSSGWTDAVLCAEANTFASWFSSLPSVSEVSYYDQTNNTYYFAIAYYMYTNTNHTSVTYWGYTGYSGDSYESFVITSPAGAPIVKSEREKPQLNEPAVGVASK